MQKGSLFTWECVWMTGPKYMSYSRARYKLQLPSTHPNLQIVNTYRYNEIA